MPVCHACLSTRLVQTSAGTLSCLDCGTQLAGFVQEAADDVPAGEGGPSQRRGTVIEGSQAGLAALTGQQAPRKGAKRRRREDRPASVVVASRCRTLARLLCVQVDAVVGAELARPDLRENAMAFFKRYLNRGKLHKRVFISELQAGATAAKAFHALRSEELARYDRVRSRSAAGGSAGDADGEAKESDDVDGEAKESDISGGSSDTSSDTSGTSGGTSGTSGGTGGASGGKLRDKGNESGGVGSGEEDVGVTGRGERRVSFDVHESRDDEPEPPMFEYLSEFDQGQTSKKQAVKVVDANGKVIREGRGPFQYQRYDLSDSLPSALTLAAIYAACVWLREPITPGDLLDMCVLGHMPYRDFEGRVPGEPEGNAEELKEDCEIARNHLRATFDHLPTPRRLYELASHMAAVARIAMPPANMVALNGRFVEELGLPESFANASKNLLTLIALPDITLGTYHDDANTRGLPLADSDDDDDDPHRAKAPPPGTRENIKDALMPMPHECALACICICLKLMCQIDCPRGENDGWAHSDSCPLSRVGVYPERWSWALWSREVQMRAFHQAERLANAPTAALGADELKTYVQACKRVHFNRRLKMYMHRKPGSSKRMTQLSKVLYRSFKAHAATLSRRQRAIVTSERGDRAGSENSGGSGSESSDGASAQSSDADGSGSSGSGSESNDSGPEDGQDGGIQSGDDQSARASGLAEGNTKGSPEGNERNGAAAGPVFPMCTCGAMNTASFREQKAVFSVEAADAATLGPEMSPTEFVSEVHRFPAGDSAAVLVALAKHGGMMPLRLNRVVQRLEASLGAIEVGLERWALLSAVWDSAAGESTDDGSDAETDSSGGQ